MSTKQKIRSIKTNGLYSQRIYQPFGFISPAGDVNTYVAVPCLEEDLSKNIQFNLVEQKKINGIFYSFFELRIPDADPSKDWNALLMRAYPSVSGPSIIKVIAIDQNGNQSENRVGITIGGDLPQG